MQQIFGGFVPDHLSRDTRQGGAMRRAGMPPESAGRTHRRTADINSNIN